MSRELELKFRIKSKNRKRAFSQWQIDLIEEEKKDY